MARERPQTRADAWNAMMGGERRPRMPERQPMRRRRVDVANVAAPEASSAWLGPETLRGRASADGYSAVVWFVLAVGPVPVQKRSPHSIQGLSVAPVFFSQRDRKDTWPMLMVGVLSTTSTLHFSIGLPPYKLSVEWCMVLS